MTYTAKAREIARRAGDHVRYHIDEFVHHVAMMIPLKHDAPMQDNKLFMRLIGFAGLIYGARSKQEYLFLRRVFRGDASWDDDPHPLPPKGK
jgi:hypothetical protein